MLSVIFGNIIEEKERKKERKNRSLLTKKKDFQILQAKKIRIKEKFWYIFKKNSVP